MFFYLATKSLFDQLMDCNIGYCDLLYFVDSEIRIMIHTYVHICRKIKLLIYFCQRGLAVHTVVHVIVCWIGDYGINEWIGAF